MLKRSHVVLADSVLSSIQSQIDFRINRLAYLFGSIAPDFNCIYPTHTISNTIGRLQKRIIRVDRLNVGFIKSFTLGVIMHYICDYFCYAHNLNKIDPMHALYERKLRKHILLNDRQDILENKWESITEQISTESHIIYIINAIKEMHSTYISETTAYNNNKWYSSKQKMQLDIDYAGFMCEKIALLILAPDKEVKVSPVGTLNNLGQA